MAENAAAPTVVNVTINGRALEARPGELLIEAAERAGTYVPRFCYHPRMEPVGVCRMCLVEVEGPRGATLQPACYLPVTEGMIVNTETDKVKKAQDGVLEFLLANHPLDCPVCDKGGECPLQDQTLAHGSGETRFIEEKRHFAKPIPIGDLVLLDRERCIQCSRCTRFAAEVAGDAAIDFAGRGDNIEVAAFPSEPFDSVFSGNTVQICPVGALTAKPYRFAARPWDLEQVESSCTTCAVQCRVAVQSSAGRLTRVLGVDSDPVNHGWLCDKGRFVIDAVGAEDATNDPLDATGRISQPLVRRDGVLTEATWGEALAAAASILHDATAAGANAVGVIGGAALTNEGAFAWERFARQVLRTENVDAQYGDGLDGALVAALNRATIDDAANARVVVTLGGDLREELPVLFLRLRESFVKGTSSLLEIATSANSLRALASISLAARPGEVHLVARALAGDDVAYATLSTHPHGAGFTTESLNAARALIGEGEGVVFVVGRPNAAEAQIVADNAVRTLAERFGNARFLTALRRSNVIGALDMGMAPGLRPGRSSVAAQGRENSSTSQAEGRGTLDQLRALASGEQRALVLLGGTLSGNVADVALVERALAKGSVIAVTGHGGADLAHVDVVLPAAVDHERSGTVTNIEGRVSAVVAKVTAPGSAWNDVAIASELAEQLGQSIGLDSETAAAAAIESTTGYPCMSVLNDQDNEGIVVSRPDERTARRVLDPMAFPGIRSVETAGPVPRAGSIAEASTPQANMVARVHLSDVSESPVPSIALADAYSLRVVASRRLYDLGAAVRATEPIAALVASAAVHANPYDLNRLGATTGDIVKVVTARGTYEMPVVTDAGVIRGTVEMALNAAYDGTDVLGAGVIDADSVVVEIRLESR